MKRIAYHFRATSEPSRKPATTDSSVGTGVLASRAQVDRHPRPAHLHGSKLRNAILSVSPILLAVSIILTAAAAHAASRPQYGGTLRIMMASAPSTLEVAANATATEYWDLARTLSLIGDSLVQLDIGGRPQAALAVAWRNDPNFRHWQFTLRSGVKFHDGSPASPETVAQILSAIHSEWKVQAIAGSVTIDSEAPMPFLLAEVALPQNLLLKRNSDGLPIGTGPFLIADWQPGIQLKLVANENGWAGRPFVDFVEIEYGKSLRDQSISLGSDKTDIIEVAPQPPNASQARTTSSSSKSLPIELMALLFSQNSRTQDIRLRKALALVVDRKPIQNVLLQGVGEPTASILPNWMTGYSAVFSTKSNLQQARAVLENSRQPALTFSYDPTDPQAQLIAERIALYAREIGVTLQVSLTGTTDIRLTRVVLPSPDPTTSLIGAAHELGLPQPAFAATPRRDSVEELYQAERGLLDDHQVIPLFHLPIATAINPRVRNWSPDQLGRWDGLNKWNGRNDGSGETHSLADAWLADSQTENHEVTSPQAAHR